MLWKYLLIFLTLFISQWLRAAEIYEPFQTIRQYGMGGVYVFNEDDAGSMLQNPGYLCYTTGFNATLFSVGIGVGDVQSYRSLTHDGTTSLPDTSAGMSSLGPYFGKDIWLNSGGYAAMTFPCFGFAGTYGASVAFQLHNPSYPQLNTFYLLEYGAMLGGGVKLGPLASLGLNIKRMNRKGGPYIFGPDRLATISGSNGLSTLASSIENEGIAWGMDVGLASRLDSVPFNPTISMAWKDVGSSAYIKTKGDQAPERQKDNLVLGMTIDGSLPLLGLSAGVEYRHITDTGEQLGKKIHLGTELHLAFIDLRAGMYQGYTTYGFGLDLWLFRLEGAWYKVETGAYPGQSPQERIQIGIMAEIGLDANFNLLDFNGRKRHLKQRR